MSFRIGNRLNRRWHPWLHGGSATDLAEIQQPMPDSIRLDVETWHGMRGLGLRDGIEDYEPEIRRYWASNPVPSATSGTEQKHTGLSEKRVRK